MNTSKTTSSAKSTEAAKGVRNLVRWWYDYGREVKDRGGHVAWVMFAAPSDVLLAMDVVPYGTEQYAAACAAKQAALPFCEIADGEGYNLDICGYERLGLGYAAMAKDGIVSGAPYGGLPKPDMAIGRTHCEPGYKWYQALQRYMKLPVFVYDNLMPWPDSGHFVADEVIREQYTTYYRETLDEMVAFLEATTGRRLDHDRLREIVRISQESHRLFYEVYEMRKAIPAPLPSEDHMTSVFPFLTMVGTPQALEFFRKLHAEVKDRVNNKTGAFPGEKYRLMWTGVPLWYQTSLFTQVQQYDAVFAIDYSFVPVQPMELDLSDPLRALAQRDARMGPIGLASWTWPGRGTPACGPFAGCYRPVSRLLQLVNEYKIDGVVMHHMPSCRNSMIGHMHAIKTLRKMGIPTLLIESDMVDPRSHNEARVLSDLESFMQMVKSTREAK